MALSKETARTIHATLNRLNPQVADLLPGALFENPAERNTQTVQNILKTIYMSIEPETYFEESRPMNIQLRNGKTIETLLSLYVRPPSDVGAITMYPFGINILCDDALICHRSWNAKHYTNIPTQHIAITSSSETAPDYEGNGLGKSLGLSSDLVITEMIRHYPVSWKKLPIKGVIVDVASGNVKKRYHWSSSLAQSMGYQETSEEVFVKHYR